MSTIDICVAIVIATMVVLAIAILLRLAKRDAERRAAMTDDERADETDWNAR